MARTTRMKLIELMALKQDISKVVEFLGKKGVFQFEDSDLVSGDDGQRPNKEKEIFATLQQIRTYLNVQDREDGDLDCALPSDDDYDTAQSIVDSVEQLKKRETELTENFKKVKETYREALAFSNLKAAYSDLEHLSFLTLRIGKIDPQNIDRKSVV